MCADARSLSKIKNYSMQMHTLSLKLLDGFKSSQISP